MSTRAWMTCGFVAAGALLATCGGKKDDAPDRNGTVAPDGHVDPTAACMPKKSAGAVAAPKFVRNLAAGETGWFSSPAIVDLDGDGKKEIVAPLYSTFVYDASGKQLAKGQATGGRVYAPGVVVVFNDTATTE